MGCMMSTSTYKDAGQGTGPNVPEAPRTRQGLYLQAKYMKNTNEAEQHHGLGIGI